jgi:myo-inositol-1(or 4)-monophosphatase
MDDLDRRLGAARRIATEAGALAKTYFAKRSDLAVEAKGAQDYVSVADREVERFIRGAFAAEFPGDGFLGEESGGTDAEALWVVDPIDGTTNFVRGIPHFAVSIGFVLRGRTELGVIHDVMAGELYSCRRGAGAEMNGQRIRVRATRSMGEAVIGFGHSGSADPHGFVQVIEQMLSAGAEFRRFGSAALMLCYTAIGRLDAFWQTHLSPWDALAGMLLVEEAGGFSNDFLANDGIRRGSAVLAGVPALKDELSRQTGISVA